MQVRASFDDASVEDKHLAALMEHLGIPTIFYWPANWQFYNNLSKRATLTDAEADAIAAKHEIGSHTLFHPRLTRIPFEQAKAEIEQSRTALQRRFNQPINSFCYPRGYANDPIRQAVRNAGYTSARNTLVGALDPGNNPVWQHTTVHIGRDRVEYNGVPWLEFALSHLHKAQQTPGSVFHFWGHGWEITENRQWANVGIFLNEVAKVMARQMVAA